MKPCPDDIYWSLIALIENEKKKVNIKEVTVIDEILE